MRDDVAKHHIPPCKILVWDFLVAGVTFFTNNSRTLGGTTPHAWEWHYTVAPNIRGEPNLRPLETACQPYLALFSSSQRHPHRVNLAIAQAGKYVSDTGCTYT